MFDLSVPTTRDERRHARRTWASYPYALRREVVSAAKRGQRHPDEAAVRAAVHYSAAALRPFGPHWWQSRRGDRWAWPLVLAAAVLLAGASVWSIAAPGPSEALDWGVLLLALVFGLLAAFALDQQRGCRRFLAASLPTVAPPH